MKIEILKALKMIMALVKLVIVEAISQMIRKMSIAETAGIIGYYMGSHSIQHK